MIIAGKYIGSGVGAIGCGLGSVGAGILFKGTVEGISRNPGQRGQLLTTSLILFSLVEALGLFSLLISLLILFG
jgi:F-type H+-transporting ATPase subunit c